MNKFFAYFDFLGYKDFITKNDEDHIRTRVGHILRDIEICIGQGKFIKSVENPYTVNADLSNSKINCLTISDTVLFWTNNDEIEDFEELIRVVHEFNWRENLYNFPIRGTIVYSKVELFTLKKTNEHGGTYNVNMIYGKGLVNAHIKAESLNWAGTVIDKSAFDKLSTLTDAEEFLKPYASKYNIPYKNDIYVEEFAFRLCNENISPDGIVTWSENITNVFKKDNKSIESERAKTLLDNTLTFLKSFGT